MKRREETFPTEGGTLPERKLSVTQRYLRDVTLPKCGMAPVREFIRRSTLVIADALANRVAGI